MKKSTGVKVKSIRWHLRLENYNKALAQLNNAMNIVNDRELSELEWQGVIQSFEFTHELAWKVIKDYFLFQGNSEIRGSRDATREAIKYQLISDGDVWMHMISSRNSTSHTYDACTAKHIVQRITKEYIVLFNKLSETMEALIELE
jgi:nucleotidyltransferase substrate binding protein (TIGR01987 family)